eukprot:CAMPEP_0182476568 /NCGR_PEP_ID=MMETSP1319-20130603/29332_1 /TAXON_ID=172717 /ORGANISM="Bolidomonas pacifica, Strain RCC208" /LENGTH=32 /DNA_ID= /DNA_START= /DNA_END= /DNA_ORIENTATION=
MTRFQSHLTSAISFSPYPSSAWLDYGSLKALI